MSGICNEMTLKSPLEDLRETTLAAVSGRLAQLAYLGSLRGEKGYLHWGISQRYGEEATDRALKTAHHELLSIVLRTPISDLEEDVRASSHASGETAGAYMESMRRRVDELLPSPGDLASARHLNSVLTALSSLEKTRTHATPSVS
jgi:hypothetical protein